MGFGVRCTFRTNKYSASITPNHTASNLSACLNSGWPFFFARDRPSSTPNDPETKPPLIQCISHFHKTTPALGEGSALNRIHTPATLQSQKPSNPCEHAVHRSIYIFSKCVKLWYLTFWPWRQDTFQQSGKQSDVLGPNLSKSDSQDLLAATSCEGPVLSYFKTVKESEKQSVAEKCAVERAPEFCSTKPC